MKRKTTTILTLAMLLMCIVTGHTLRAEGVSGNVFLSDPGTLPDDKQLGTDLTTAWGKICTPDTKVEPGKAVKYSFVAYNDITSNWFGPYTMLRKEDGTEYAVLRTDNYGWGTGYKESTNLTLESNWDWETFKADINEATFTVYAYNKGNNLADVYMHITTKEGAKHFQYYKNIIVDSNDLYVSMTAEKSYLIFNDISSETSYPTKIIKGNIPDNNQLATDTNTDYGSVTTPETKLEAGQAAQYSFTVKSLAELNWQSALYIIKEEGDATFADYIIGRNDNFLFGPGGNIEDKYNSVTRQSNWIWDNNEFLNDLDDAKITATIINMGNNTAEIHISYIGGKTGKSHYQEFRNIPFEGDYFYTMLSCEKSYLIFDKTEEDNATAITTPESNIEVVSTKYYNLLGTAIDEGYKGIVLKVEQLSNGTTRTTKCIK